MSPSGADVFEQLAAEGSEALHRGDAPTAAECLERAFAVEPAADQVDARADLMEARLRLGRHRAVVAELTTLVERHPACERLRRQLVLALARSGRRQEALAVCSSAPAGPLLDELRRAIERGDVLSSEHVAHRRLSARAVGAAAAGAAVLLATAVATAALWPDGSRPAGQETTRARARQPDAHRAAPNPTRPDEPLPYAVDGDALWSVRADRHALVLLGPDARAQRRVRVDGRVDALALAHGSFWIVDATRERLLRVSERTGRRERSLPLGRGPLGRQGAPAVVASGAWVWATNGGPLLRLDARTGTVLDRVELDGPTALVADRRGVWVGTRTGELARVAPGTSRSPVARFPGIPGRVVRLVRAHGSLWVVRGDPGDADLWRYETTPAALYGTPVNGRFTADLVARAGAMWARMPSSAYARIDAVTTQVELVERESPSAVSPQAGPVATSATPLR